MPPSRSDSGLRAALLHGAPVLALIALVTLPVIAGQDTLILRDVHPTHLMLEAGPAQALREGVLPVLDVHRGGGQPFTGNPNAVPFHPSRLLQLAGSTLWALNAHFWLHWLLAPFGLYLLGRAWGLGRPGAWAAGVCWATSGYFLSQLNLYNLVAGVATVPFLVAACLRAVEERATEEGERIPRRRWAAAAGLAWALVLVSGDPSSALAGALLAVGAVAARSPRALIAPRRLAPLVVGIACGTLLALPQIVELLRVLPATDRGVRGVGEARLTMAAWRPESPAGWLGWLVPGDWAAYGFRTESGAGGRPPFFLSLYPGLAAVALAVVGTLPRRDRARRARVWSWGTIVVGLVLAAGAATPLGRLVYDLPGLRLFRYPIKLWLLVAVAASVLCGLGFERIFRGRGDGGAGRRRWVVAGALLLALHGASQLYLLRGLVATDAVATLAGPSPLLGHLPAGARVAHPHLGLLGPRVSLRVPARLDRDEPWELRQRFDALTPGAGILQADLRYELTRTPEGLSSFLLRVAHDAVAVTPSDAGRLLALSRWGVEHALSERPLRGVPPELAEETVAAGAVAPIHLYRLRRPAPEIALADRPVRVPHLGAAWALFVAPRFDPARHVVLPPADGAEGMAEDAPVPALPAVDGPSAGRFRVLSRGDEALEVETASPVPTVLVVQRALQPVWRATVDGEPAAIEAANLYRMGVEVPAGRHRVRLWVDRRPLHRAFAGAAIGALGLLVLAFAGGRRPGSGPVARRGADTIPDP